jgi:hypothetical protein
VARLAGFRVRRYRRANVALNSRRYLNMNSVRALSELQLDDAARARLDILAQKANEGQLAPEEAREYERFIDVSDIISTLRLKAERQVGDLALAQ